MVFNILIVEDDPIYLYIQNRIFSNLTSRNEIISFENGKLAYDYLTRKKDPFTAYLIFLDIDMPVINGWEFMYKLNNYGMNSNLTIVILSSSIDKYDIDSAKKYDNIITYIQKPMYRKNLKELPLINNFLEKLEID